MDGQDGRDVGGGCLASCVGAGFHCLVGRATTRVRPYVVSIVGQTGAGNRAQKWLVMALALRSGG